MPDDGANLQWPPRSPYEALMTSPSSKRRLQQRTNRTSPSPSPLKTFGTTPSLRRTHSRVMSEPREEGDEEDEETLQLQLQALEAKIKLKKLQSRRAKDQTNSENEDSENRPKSRATSVLSSRRDRAEPPRLVKSKSSTDIQVPLSPDKRKTTVAQEQRSPGRVLLGIDKGLRGRNVSLRRPPTLRAPDDPFTVNTTNAGATPGASLSRHTSIGRSSGREIGKTFNERIAETRDHEKKEQERKYRIEHLRRQRSAGFGIQDHELDHVKRVTAEEQEQRQSSQQRSLETGFSRDDVLRAVNKPAGGLVQRTSTVSGVRNSRHESAPSVEAAPRPRSVLSTRTSTQDRPSSQLSSTPSDSSQPQISAGDSSLYEPYSSTNLSRRILPHTFLKRTISDDKTPVLIPQLLSTVKAPTFELPPELETSNIVLFATIATKSAPLTHKDNHRSTGASFNTQTASSEAAASRENDKGKYMIFTLTDLKWTVDLFLFGSAYTRWSKLTAGTLVAILNPNIMPPPKHKIDTGRWSLTLNCAEDTILEIGTNKDLGWCKALKKDGKQCEDWVDRRKTDYCEFHVDAGVDRMRKGRMETQGVGAGFAPGGKRGGRQGFFGSGRVKKGGGGERGDGVGRDELGRWTRDNGIVKEGKGYDRGLHSSYFIAPARINRSAASLLDADEDGDRGGREERVRKMLADREREREIAKKLGSGGNGAGAEYLRGPEARSGRSLGSNPQSKGENTMEGIEIVSEHRDAASLGLKGNNAKSVMLSPLKRKRSVADGTAPKKKTRFVTAKGIREAGRDSLPGPLADDDDDGLDII